MLEPRAESGTASSARLLALERDPVAAAGVAELCREALLSLVLARDEDEAIAQARALRVDAALVDVSGAAGETGFSVAHRLRALPGYGRLPLAFMSSEGSLEQRIAAA